MNKFFELNRKKIWFAYKAISITLFLLILIPIAFVCFNGDIHDKSDYIFALVLLFTAIFGFPVFIIILSYLEWIRKKRIRNRGFATPPFDKLNEIGFVKSLLNKNTKWELTEEVKEASINSFNIRCDIKYKYIEFEALVEYIHIEKLYFQKLKKELKENDIAFTFDGLAKIYNIKNNNLDSIQQLKVEMENFTEILKQRIKEVKNQ